MPLPTKVSSRFPRSYRAVSRLAGEPALGPKDDNAIEAPSSRSAIAFSGAVIAALVIRKHGHLQQQPELVEARAA